MGMAKKCENLIGVLFGSNENGCMNNLQQKSGNISLNKKQTVAMGNWESLWILHW